MVHHSLDKGFQLRAVRSRQDSKVVIIEPENCCNLQSVTPSNTGRWNLHRHKACQQKEAWNALRSKTNSFETSIYLLKVYWIKESRWHCCTWSTGSWMLDFVKSNVTFIFHFTGFICLQGHWLEPCQVSLYILKHCWLYWLWCNIPIFQTVQIWDYFF